MLPEAGMNGQQHDIRLVIGGNRGIDLALVEAQLGKPEVALVMAAQSPGDTALKGNDDEQKP